MMAIVTMAEGVEMEIAVRWTVNRLMMVKSSKNHVKAYSVFWV